MSMIAAGEAAPHQHKSSWPEITGEILKMQAKLTTQRNAKSPTLTEKLRMIVQVHLVKELLTYPAVVELIKSLTTRRRDFIFYFSFRPGLVEGFWGTVAVTCGFMVWTDFGT